MFHFSGKLDHLLEPRAYYDPAWYEREQAAIFRPGWNLLCLADEVAKPGDRFAGSVGGVAVVVVNDDGELKAFSNVCGHRHSLICPVGPGHGERLRCQIHGWEYDCDGNLAKIPDGKHFRVVKPGDFNLRRFRVARSGPAVFVNLSEDAPTFEQHLGSLAPEFHQWYDDVRLVNTWIHEHDVNWKIPVENSVESYHVPVIHPTTFQNYREEELHDHRLEPTYTRYGDLLPYSGKRSLLGFAFRTFSRVFIRNPTYERFTHTHLFPNIMLYYADVFRGITVFDPIGPKRVRFRGYGFVPRDVRYGPIGRLVQDASMVVFYSRGRKITHEDVAFWPAVQAGLESSSHSGVLSAREERVYAFQRYVKSKLTQ